jgi:imidazoleglycerol phosphate dehydratase HisB
LIFGTGTGASSAMEHLLAELRHNDRDIAERIVGSIAVDEHHLTEDQLLAKARELFVVSNKPAAAPLRRP